MIKNLISAKDYTALKKKDSLTGDEMLLLQQEKWTESEVQCASKNIFIGYAMQFPHALYQFQKNDNGRDYDQPKKSDTEIVKYRKKKIISSKVNKQKREGMIVGFPDVTLWKISPKNKKTDLVEFKRPKETSLSKSQEIVHKQFLDAGKEVYLCNNTIYFEKVICKEFFYNN